MKGKVLVKGLVIVACLLMLPAYNNISAQVISFPGIEKVLKPEFLENVHMSEEKIDIIVLLEDYTAFRGASISDNREKMRMLQSEIRIRQDQVISTLDRNHFELKHQFENISGFSGKATLQAIEALTKRNDVKLIEKDQKVFMHTAQGIPLIKADQLHPFARGSGVSIAIVDTGVGPSDYLIDKVIGGYDWGDNDAGTTDCNGHGTACAGIAAGDYVDGGIGDYIGGVATEAKIYALKISTGCNGSAQISNIAAAWDWCVTHKNDDPSNPIMIISTSFGGGYYTSSCDEASFSVATAAANALANGITIFASSGNEGYCDGMASPACMTDVISVGSVYDDNIGRSPEPGFVGCIANESCVGYKPRCFCDEKCYVDETTAADQVPSYSNSASFLDILAPSNCAATSGLGDDTWNCFGGTSAACPYAAGAAAVLQSYAKDEIGRFLTPFELKSELINNGDLLTDSKNGLTHPRVNVLASANAITQLCNLMGDSDNDSICDDGDNSGFTDDNPCTGGETDNCDDNCSADYNPNQNDSDGDSHGDLCDNCSDTPNPGQEDTYPPQGNGIGDACDCECDFDCDGDVDATDVDGFLTDFGRSWIINPCANDNPCNGDCECDTDVDSADVEKLLEDFGRSWIINPCPTCVAGDWCVYP